MRFIFVPFLFVFSSCSQAHAQPLRNLDFEEYDPVTLKLPAWHLTNAFPRAVGNENSIGLDQLPDGVIASMYTPDSPLGGKYGLGLYPGGKEFPWLVSQRGTIPADAKSMSFEIRGAQVSLEFDNAELPLQYYFRPDIALAGWNLVDVSAFAGQTVTMEIIATGITGPQIPARVTGLDNFRFSSEPVPLIPEPGTLALSILGAVLAFLHWRSSKAPR